MRQTTTKTTTSAASIADLRARAAAEIEKIKQDLRSRQDWLAGFDRYTGWVDTMRPVGQTARVPQRHGAGAGQRRRVQRGRTAVTRKIVGQEIVPAVLELLKTEGHPLTRTEIVQKLRRQGVRVSGEDPQRNVAAVLWRVRGRIGNLKGHGYWPVGEPCPSIGYVPRTSEEMPAVAAE